MRGKKKRITKYKVRQIGLRSHVCSLLINYQCPANKLDVSLCRGIVFTECSLLFNKSPFLTGKLATVAFQESVCQGQRLVSE